jgi:hypothetical protein
MLGEAEYNTLTYKFFGLINSTDLSHQLYLLLNKAHFKQIIFLVML